MTKGSKEFHEMQSQFEKDLKNMPIYIGGKVVRDTSGMKGQWYTHETVNKLFIGYMTGYQCGRVAYMH